MRDIGFQVRLNASYDEAVQRTAAATKARYNRIARIYDLMETMSEGKFKPWREKLWSLTRGNILEVGVGTGKNFPFHPRLAKVTGIDLSDQMLVRAKERAHACL